MTTSTNKQRPSMRVKYSWEQICRMRDMFNIENLSISHIARVFKANRFYVAQVVHGESRPTEDSPTRHKAPVVLPRNYPEQFIRSPEGSGLSSSPAAFST